MSRDPKLSAPLAGQNGAEIAFPQMSGKGVALRIDVIAGQAGTSENTSI